MHLYNISVGRLLNKQSPEQIAWEATREQEEQDEQDEADAALKAALPANANAEARKRRSRAVRS